MENKAKGKEQTKQTTPTHRKLQSLFGGRGGGLRLKD